MNVRSEMYYIFLINGNVNTLGRLQAKDSVVDLQTNFVLESILLDYEKR